MPHELPYLASYKNVGPLFEKIQNAKVPETFTQQFLAETLGLKSSGDRQLIALLKRLGFLDSSGKPNQSYSQLKNKAVAPVAIANGVRSAYGPLFDANEDAHELSSSELNGLIAQVAGSDSSATKKISGTLRALMAVADFSQDGQGEAPNDADELGDAHSDAAADAPNPPIPIAGLASGLNPEFHYNFQIHLPANGSEETYLNIFTALRKVFR